MISLTASQSVHMEPMYLLLQEISFLFFTIYVRDGEESPFARIRIRIQSNQSTLWLGLLLSSYDVNVLKVVKRWQGHEACMYCELL